MKIFAIAKLAPGKTLEDVKPLRVDEATMAWQFYKSSTLQEIYFRQDQPGVVVMLECADVEEAKEKIATLPMVKAGVLDYDVIPLLPYLGYELLFANSNQNRQ